jgi:hypothetical protein
MKDISEVMSEGYKREYFGKLLEYFRYNPLATDADLFEYAEKVGIDYDELLDHALALVGMFVGAGKYVNEGGHKHIDQTQLRMGIEVEKEHTVCELIAERIAKDHLTEIPDYYTRLKHMEEDAGIKG